MSCLGKLCSASLQAQAKPQPRHTSLAPAAGGFELGPQYSQDPPKILHWATIPWHFTKGKGNLVCRKQTANIWYHFFLNCLSSSASLLFSRDEHPGYSLKNAWKWVVVPWSCNYSLWEGHQREAAHHSPLPNIVKCTWIICHNGSSVRCCKTSYWLETDLNKQRKNSENFELAFSAGLSSNHTSATPGSTQHFSRFLEPAAPTEAQISLSHSWWLGQSIWVDTENSWEFCGLGYKAGKKWQLLSPLQHFEIYFLYIIKPWGNDQFWLKKAGICVFSC